MPLSTLLRPYTEISPPVHTYEIAIAIGHYTRALRIGDESAIEKIKMLRNVDDLIVACCEEIEQMTHETSPI